MGLQELWWEGVVVSAVRLCAWKLWIALRRDKQVARSEATKQLVYFGEANPEKRPLKIDLFPP